MKRIYLILWCTALAILAYIVLDYWQVRNAPLYKRFERQWSRDVGSLENSKKMPSPWFDVAEVELIGGNPEGKKWLKQIRPPVGIKNAQGNHKLEVLVVPWHEEGTDGVMVQYNIVNLKSKNMIFELGRTLILSP